jgi:hypothetical protein
MKPMAFLRVKSDMRWIIGLVSIVLATSAFAQNIQIKVKRQPVQLRVRHADPWAIKTLLEGGQLRSPELSTILALMGGQPPAGNNNGTPLFPDGKFVVNPGDNTLWFIPNP